MMCLLLYITVKPFKYETYKKQKCFVVNMMYLQIIYQHEALQILNEYKKQKALQLVSNAQLLCIFPMRKVICTCISLQRLNCSNYKAMVKGSIVRVWIFHGTIVGMVGSSKVLIINTDINLSLVHSIGLIMFHCGSWNFLWPLTIDSLAMTGSRTWVFKFDHNYR